MLVLYLEHSSGMTAERALAYLGSTSSTAGLHAYLDQAALCLRAAMRWETAWSDYGYVRRAYLETREEKVILPRALCHACALHCSLGSSCVWNVGASPHTASVLLLYLDLNFQLCTRSSARGTRCVRLSRPVGLRRAAPPSRSRLGSTWCV